MNSHCPTCHQPVRHNRLGVYLPPFKAAIVDAIKASGDVGISSAELVNLLGRPRRTIVIKSHVSQINDLLEETDWKIVADGRAGARWKLRCIRRAAA